MEIHETPAVGACSSVRKAFDYSLKRARFSTNISKKTLYAYKSYRHVKNDELKSYDELGRERKGKA